ncbi:Gfo/Idh/MocA family protein [Alicyclobacillus herbarius]|uniref:Gfo/Idh/MocA family protein n=1 Tax=Alicyclobacillus herbarius TaxID=122960 RepID=UPI00041F2B5B|nr:Gfo/Idh/MocA family oxidoreductase [Alicyclobacillus herbarius]
MSVQTSYRVGIAGAGAFAAFLAQSLAPLTNFKLTAVAGRTEKKRRAVIETYHAHRVSAPSTRVAATEAPREYEDATQLVADAEVDVVIVTTPPHLHAPLTALALERGKHVLVEKPGALSAKALDQNGRLAKKNGLALAVNLVQPFNPLVWAVGQLLRLGVLGRPWHAELHNSVHRVPDDSHWFWSSEQSGGIFVEHGVHFFEVARRWFGAAVQAEGQYLLDEAGRASRVFAHAVHENPKGQQTVVQYYHGFTLNEDIPESTAWQLHMEKGVITVEGWIPMELRIRARLRKAEAELCDVLLDAVPIQPTNQFLTKLAKLNLSPTPTQADAETIPYVRCVRLANRQGWYEAMVQARWLDFCAMVEDPNWSGYVAVTDAVADLTLALACTPSEAWA